MIWLISDTEYGKSVWGYTLRDGLRKELKRKRLNYTERTEPNEATAGDVVFLIHSDRAMFARQIAECNARQIVPILLCGTAQTQLHGRFHCVCASSADALIEQVHTAHHPALYGVNPDSATDMDMLNALRRVTDLPVYWNRTSLRDCFAAFAPHVSEHDRLICTNDFAAVSLLRNLRALYPVCLPVQIVSCNATVLSACFQPDIRALPCDWAGLGKTAAAVMEFVAKNPFISNLTAAVSAHTASSGVDLADEPELRTHAFYADTELQEMMRVVRLMNQWDETDRTILPMLLRGDTYDAIAERAFLSKSTLQYRLRRWMDCCEVSDKASLIAVLRPYLGTRDEPQNG